MLSQKVGRVLRLAVVAGWWFVLATNARAQSAAQLLEQTARVRGMNEADLRNLVPLQSGLQYVPCPNCTSGRQERQLVWSIDRPDEVCCQFCQHCYPSDKYPMTKSVAVRTPSGKSATFDYWENDAGYRHFFKARRDFEVKQYLSRQTLLLAQLYSVTKDPAHARRAALLLNRFAEVFPDWCYHYDYPFQQKLIYDGDVSPSEFRKGFRTARWNWWAYSDIPEDLVEAYQLIRASGALEELAKTSGTDVVRRIEDELIRNASEQVVNNHDDFTNMSPYAWRDLISVGRTIREPRYAHEVVRRFKKLMETQFFYDGIWYEGAPSYGKQTVNSLRAFLQELRGYSDPPGTRDPVDGTRFDNLDLEQDYPQLRQAQEALSRLRFPDGRLVPVHDTWSSAEKSSPVPEAQSYLLPALGHAALMAGSGPERAEVHLTWSGGYGHQHADVLSLILFAQGRELLSDLGYTHTAYRSWTLATAAHNTVVIDGQSQEPGSRSKPTDGRLEFIDLTRPGVKAVRAEGTRAYPGKASRYVRTQVVVEVDRNHCYVVDLFDVAGGETHDYFLHGDADALTTVTSPVSLQPLTTLLPAGMKWEPTRNEGESGKAYQGQYAYGFLRKLRAGELSAGAATPVDFRVSGQPAGVRVTLMPESRSELVLGVNPSIRLAHEDDSQLTKHDRPFLMLRRRPEKSESRFLAVLEPHSGEPFLTSVRRLSAPVGVTAVEVRAGKRTDLIVLNSSARTSFEIEAGGLQTATFQGDVGVLTIEDAQLRSAYALGRGGWEAGPLRQQSAGPQTGSLLAVGPQSLTVKTASGAAPAAGQIVRLTTTDGWVYPYTVRKATPAASQGAMTIEVAEGPGLTFDHATKRLALLAFPQRSHEGPVSVDWQTSVFDSASPAAEGLE